MLSYASLFFPLGLGNELGNILGVCSAERRQAYMWSPFLPRPLLLPKIFFSGSPACSPPAHLQGPGQGPPRALFTSVSALSTCGVLTVYLSVSPPPSGSLSANGLVFLINSPLCSFGPMLCTWGLCSKHLWFRDPQHEYHLEPERSAESQTPPSPLESQSSI